MNPSSAKILQYVAGYEAIKDVSIEELQKQADEHPYFAVSQFLLAKKLHDEGEEGFLPAAQKAALYFSNPQWLHYKLIEKDNAQSQPVTQTVSEFEKHKTGQVAPAESDTAPAPDFKTETAPAPGGANIAAIEPVILSAATEKADNVSDVDNMQLRHL